VPVPAAPAAGEALVRVHRVGICGTDLGGYLGKMPFFSYPRIPGHELGVEVLAVGPERDETCKPGDRCCGRALYQLPGQCYSCRRGHTNCCEHHKTLGVMCDGGLAERILLPARKLHIPPEAHLRSARAGRDPRHRLPCRGPRRHPKPGETVLVIGAGPIGLSALEFARISGARCLVVMDRVERRPPPPSAANVMQVDRIIAAGHRRWRAKLKPPWPR
jgi:threonine dehydrogenase-like Zn-dependent dehydrogenase